MALQRSRRSRKIARAMTESRSVSGERRSSLSSKCCATPSRAGSEAGTSAGTSSRPRNCAARAAHWDPCQRRAARARRSGGAAGACAPCDDPARRAPRRAGSAAGVPAANLSTARTLDQQIGGCQVRMAVSHGCGRPSQRTRSQGECGGTAPAEQSEKGVRVRARVSRGWG